MWIGVTAVMAHKPSNDAVLEQLKNGIAQFELVYSPVPSISTSSISQANPTALFGGYSHRFFARTSNFAAFSYSVKNLFPWLSGRSSVHNSAQSDTCEGRCLFRALAKGIEANKEHPFTETDEISKDAEEIQLAVEQVICGSGEELPEYKEDLEAIKRLDSSYCDRIRKNKFCGENSELPVLSKMLSQSIEVYEHEHTNGGIGSGLKKKYGTKFTEGSGNGKPKKAVRLLRFNCSGRNHYDLLTIGETEKEIGETERELSMQCIL